MSVADDDDLERDAYNERKSPLGFFSKFWELQVIAVFSFGMHGS